MGAELVARVLLDSPLPQLDRLFDYRIPEQLRATALPGVRVKVPLRSAGRTADGYIVELAPAGDYPGPLSELDSVVSEVPVLRPEVWALARRVADRAAGSASDVIRLAIPHRQVRVEKAWLARTDGELAPVVEAPTEHYPALADAIRAGDRVALDAVPGVVRVGADSWVGAWAATLAASASVALASGSSAIIAVPDYRDQDPVEAALRAILPSDRVLRMDARQSNPDRYRAFLEAFDDSPRVIVGNRSVVYAPAARLGLIAVWDDGDPLHSEPLTPYVHARDAALVRQELQGGALIIAGHSRSTEVERLVEVGWLRSLSPAPRVQPRVIPTANQSTTDRLAATARIPSTAWRTAREALEHGPVLVQVARPGYAPRLACADCKQTARCAKCEGPLAQRSQKATPACTWCGALAVDWSCSRCDGTTLRFVGSGAGRTADELGRAFPGVRVIVSDGERVVQTVSRDPALVVATRGAEPIAAGGYRAVLILDGEQLVARESLRVGEDCLRAWANATALAARGAPTVLVGVGGALAKALSTWSLADYARSELADRRRLRFPPAVRVATVTGSIDAVASVIAALPVDPDDVLGPVERGDGTVRTIVRFDYASGSELAGALRSEVVRAATRKRAPVIPGAAPRPAQRGLRVRFDDVEPFSDLA